MVLPIAEEEGEETKRVHLITSGAFLLSGDLDECFSPDDADCGGGMASIAALARNFTNNEATLWAQYLDKESPFVNMHPLAWVVNRFVLRDLFQLDFFIATSSLLLQNNVDSAVSPRDITQLQIADMPLLMTNVAVPTSNSWNQFISFIHFDAKTNIALINILREQEPFPLPPVESAIGALNYIHLLNQRNGCYPTNHYVDEYGHYVDSFDYTVNTTHGTFFNYTSFQDYHHANNNDNNNNGNGQKQQDQPQCWVSVILHSDREAKYYEFMDAISVHYNPPDLVVNIELDYQTVDEPTLYKDTNIWVGHCQADYWRYCQHTITMTQQTDTGTTIPALKIQNVTLITQDAYEVPDEFKDDTWEKHITYLRRLADDAEANNPIIGFTGAIPVHREGLYRACKAGECPYGNLFADAMRWRTNSDVAFTSSGGFRGPGKPEGAITFTDLYSALPFTNLLCTGTMTGISLFQLLNVSMSLATFQGENTDLGGRLLQISGMKVVYNTDFLPSRLISVDVWDNQQQAYLPLDRLRLYNFTTDAYVCGGYDPFPEYLGPNFEIEGEVPGQINDLVIQNVVAEYLSSLDEPWDSTYQGRLYNDTSATEILNLIQLEENCPPKTAWSEKTFTCFPCPQYSFVSFSDERIELQASSQGETLRTGRILLTNREIYGVSVFPKSIPSWMGIQNATIGGTSSSSSSSPSTTDKDLQNTLFNLNSGESLILDFDVFSSRFGNAGADRTALGTVAFGVEDGGGFPGCSGQDATFDVQLRITPPDDLNQLGGIRYVGFGLVAVVIAIAAYFSFWVYSHRQSRVVQFLQPIFLCTVALGVVILSLGIIPLSFDDQIISVSGCHIACMATPWLLSTGFCTSFAALFSKLWRINKLFGGQSTFQRVTVRQKDVLAPFAIIFSTNVIVLLLWTIIDPLRWKREAITINEPWNSYGACRGRGSFSTALSFLLACVNVGAMLMACHQAYLARNISTEFSESTYIGVAIYGWIQFVIIGLPVLFLIDRENPTALYFLQVAILFLVCISMLLAIFFPPIYNYKLSLTSFRFRKSQRSDLGGGNDDDVTTTLPSNSRSNIQSIRGSGISPSVRNSGAALRGSATSVRGSARSSAGARVRISGLTASPEEIARLQRNIIRPPEEIQQQQQQQIMTMTHPPADDNDNENFLMKPEKHPSDQMSTTKEEEEDDTNKIEMIKEGEEEVELETGQDPHVEVIMA